MFRAQVRSTAPSVRVALRRWLHQAATSLWLLLPLPAAAADVVAVSELSYAGLRRQAHAWEQATGHRLIWVPASVGSDETETLADVIFAPARRIGELHADKRLQLLEMDKFEEVAPLLAQQWWVEQDNLQGWIALPLPVTLPVLQAQPALLHARNEQLGPAPTWQEVARLAAALTDPLGDVHGICIDPIYPHATIVRAMLVAVGALSKGTDQNFYLDSAWQTQAQLYARMLAASGPANAASLSAAEFADLLDHQRCALWLTQWPAAVKPASQLAAVPGAAAFLRQERPAVAVARDSQQQQITLEFVRWIFMNTQEIYPLGISGYREDIITHAAIAQPAITAMLEQAQVAVSPPLGWQLLDAVAQQPLAKLIDGLLPVQDAAAAATAAAEQH